MSLTLPNLLTPHSSYGAHMSPLHKLFRAVEYRYYAAEQVCISKPSFMAWEALRRLIPFYGASSNDCPCQNCFASLLRPTQSVTNKSTVIIGVESFALLRSVALPENPFPHNAPIGVWQPITSPYCPLLSPAPPLNCANV